MRRKSSDGFIHMLTGKLLYYCMLAGVDPDDTGTDKFPVDCLGVCRRNYHYSSDEMVNQRCQMMDSLEKTATLTVSMIL